MWATRVLAALRWADEQFERCARRRVRQHPVFRTTALPAATNALSLIVLEQSNGGNGDVVFLRMQATEIYSQFDARTVGGPVAPLDTWFCLVLQVTFATTPSGAMALSGDVSPPLTMFNLTTQGTPPIDLFGVGPFYSSTNADVGQPAFDVWVDDLIVDDVGPLFCDS